MRNVSVTEIALVGAGGFVGSAIHEALARRADCRVTPVTRSSYAQASGGAYDIVINAAMPSARFWAKNHPSDDFRETVQKTADLVHTWRFRKFVQISSVSARSQLDTTYGRHKAAAERLCEFGANLIVRLGPMYGPGLAKGVLIDILKRQPVFVDGRSRYGFAPLAFAAGWIAGHLSRQGIVEVGARNGVALSDVAKHVGADVRFDGALDHQEIVDPEPDFPDASGVLRFMDEMKGAGAGQRR